MFGLHLSSETLSSLFSIIILNLVLSGNNAAIVGLAIRDLPAQQRKLASIIGTGGAIVLRVIFTIIASFLITIPYLEAIGGLILLWITWNLLQNQEEEASLDSSKSMRQAIITVIIADVSMSFDNVVAIAGAANGNLVLVIIGLIFSIPIIVYGSNWLANWMTKLPIIIYIGGAILVHTASKMIIEDHALTFVQTLRGPKETIITWTLAFLVLAWGFIQTRSSASEGEE